MFFFASCAMEKNTRITRALQSLNTRYNIYYNGNESFQEGLRAISTANKDDFSQVINMFPISNHEAARSATSQMDRAIEKSRKAIKTRSIRAKPEAGRRRRRDPNFREFAQREEFNPFMANVWLLLAKAEFHKADFLGSVGTFNYIARHFRHDAHLVQTCQLWVIRAYAEMGWLFEAEDMLSKITPSQLNQANSNFYAAVRADVLLKRGQHKEAIPWLELVVSREKDRDLRMRFSFLLGQLYQISGNQSRAHELYTRLLRMSPPYEMDFNARLARASLFIGNMNDIRRELFRMADNNNNENYLDQLYFAIGNTYLHQNDTARALHYYTEAIERSTRNGIDKAVVLIRAADIKFLRQNYVEAQPLYADAAKIIPLTHPDYPRVALRSEVLAELVVHHQEVLLQDSLQRLSAMGPEERLQNVMAWIARLEKEEAREIEREAQRQQRAESQPLSGNMGMTMIGGPGQGNQGNQGAWYFYNTALVRSGETEFQQQWGRRRLEDNWRRANRSASLFTDDNISQPLQPTNLAQGEASELEGNVNGITLPLLLQEPPDLKDPEFYLRQIPETPEQIARSNQIWANALYSMGVIYKDKLEDFALAIYTFNEYLSRFNNHEKVLDALFHNFLLHIRLEEKGIAETLRATIISRFGDSDHARMLAYPDFAGHRQSMFQKQDSLYRKAYIAFNKNQFEEVFTIVNQVRQNFPFSPLMPRFLFLNAMSTGRSRSSEAFETTLVELLNLYPESPVSSISKDMLALIRQGREAQHGGSLESILARRTVSPIGESDEGAAVMQFTLAKDVEQRLLLISPEKDEDLYALQFELAVFNFSRFILKDFDLEIRRIDAVRNAISVISFDNFNDAEWYLNALKAEAGIAALLKQLNVVPLIIAESDFNMMRSGLTIDDYLMHRAEVDEPETVETITEE